MGKPPGTVKSWIHRGIDRLRRALPASLAPGLLFLLTPTPGLAAARAHVLRLQVERVAVPTGAAATTARGLWIWITSIAAAVVLAATFWPRAEEPKPLPPQPVEVASRPAEQTTPDTEVARVPAVVTETNTPTTHRRIVAVRGPDKTPTPDIWIYVTPTSVPNPSLHAAWFKTDAQGAIDLGPDSIRKHCFIQTDRGDSRQISGNEKETVTHVQVGTDTIRGIVLGANAQGMPNVDITITMTDRLEVGRVVTVTDAAGKFAIPFVRGAHGLSASAPGFRSLPIHVFDTAKPIDVESEHRLKLSDPGSTVHFRILDEFGNPIPDARVQVGHCWQQPGNAEFARGKPISAPTRAFSDAEGWARCSGLFPGRPLPVWVRAEGKHLLMTSVTVPPPSTKPATFDLTLGAGQVLTGRVSNADGQPTIGAVVRVVHHDGTGSGRHNVPPEWGMTVTASNEQGEFRLVGIRPGTFTAYANKLDKWDSTVRHPSSGEQGPWHAVLGDGHTLRGRLIDNEGAPLANWAVRAVAAPGTKPVRPKVTNDRGEFDLSGCEDRPYTLDIYQSRDHGTAATKARAPQPSADASIRTEFRLAAHEIARAFVIGRILDHEGNPIRGPIELSSPDYKLSGKADETGQFRIGPAWDGKYCLRVQRDMKVLIFRPGITVSGTGEIDTGTLRAQDPGTIEVHTQANSDLPLEGEWITIRDPDSFHVVSVGRLKGNRCTIADMPPGTYYAVLSSERFPAWTQRVTVDAGSTATVELAPRGGVWIEFDFRYPPAKRQTLSLIGLIDENGHEVNVVQRTLIPGTRTRTRCVVPTGTFTAHFRDVRGRVKRFPLVIRPGEANAKPSTVVIDLTTTTPPTKNP